MISNEDIVRNKTPRNSQKSTERSNKIFPETEKKH
jgi:hypothetical protein